MIRNGTLPIIFTIQLRSSHQELYLHTRPGGLLDTPLQDLLKEELVPRDSYTSLSSGLNVSRKFLRVSGLHGTPS